VDESRETTGGSSGGELLFPGLGEPGASATVAAEDYRSKRNRILVADVDAGFASAVGQMTGRLDVAVAVARDFEALGNALSELDPEVVFLNLTLGDCDAIEVMRYLSERRSRAQIVLVGDADPKVLEAAERIGRSRRLTMQPSLRKPVSVSALQTAVRTLIDARPQISGQELREAIAERRILPFFQPIVDVTGAENAIVRAEVLARWDHPFHGILPAGEFIEVAEEHGLLADLTACLLNRALEHVGACREGGLVLPISINISASSLTDLTLPDTLSEIVASHGFGNDLVTIELTESAMIEGRTEILEVLTRLRMKGFSLSMDDFGTGYSTLLELVRLPFNEIKIDQIFVDRIGQRRESDIVIGSLVRLAHGLGLSVCAEGVEAGETLELLRMAGCDRAQGCYIQRPVSAGDLMTCLANWNGVSTQQPGVANLVPSRQAHPDSTLL